MGSLALPDLEQWQGPHAVQVCLLGGFRVLVHGERVEVRAGAKMEALLACLGLASAQGLGHDVLLRRIWPDSELTLARHALNSLVHRLGTLLADALSGARPIVQMAGQYRLNWEAGISVDVAEFRNLVSRGDAHDRSGQSFAASRLYAQAANLYCGDLAGGEGPVLSLERDRLRAMHLALLMRLADLSFARRELSACLAYATELLTFDPCREDAHRLIMRCHVRRGERSQALRHYRTVTRILQSEFDVAPEPATDALFEQIRMQPAAI